MPSFSVFHLIDAPVKIIRLRAIEIEYTGSFGNPLISLSGFSIACDDKFCLTCAEVFLDLFLLRLRIGIQHAEITAVRQNIRSQIKTVIETGDIQQCRILICTDDFGKSRLRHIRPLHLHQRHSKA